MAVLLATFSVHWGWSSVNRIGGDGSEHGQQENGERLLSVFDTKLW
jgi:hypothetical protein